MPRACRLRGVRGEPLTADEERLVRLVCRGLDNYEIAAELGGTVNRRTVTERLTAVYRKVGIVGRTGAARARLAYWWGKGGG